MLKKIILFVGLVELTLFFRFYKFHSFQYWSDDEQIIWFIIRHIIIDQHPSLVVPNAALGISLGPLLHYLLSLWYNFVHFDPEKILLLGNFIALINLVAIYLAGKTVVNKKVGLIAAFLYATSFMASLFDRRVWALTLNVFLISLSIIALTQIIRGHSKYLILLTIPIIFSVNSDPSLALIIPASLIVFIIFRPRIQLKHLIISIFMGIFLLSPLIYFDIRHGGQNIKSLINHTSLQFQKSNSNIKNNLLTRQLNNFSILFFPKPTLNADAYFCYCFLDKIQSPVRVIFSTAFLLLFIIFTIKQKSKTNLVLLLLLLSYLGGIFVFGKFLNGFPAFFYSITILPVILLMLATLLSTSRLITVLFLIFYLIININTLFKSEFKYPLAKRMQLVKKTIQYLPANQPFSLYHSGDILLAGGGWTSLFASQSYIPSKGSLSMYWGHIYNSYQIYPIPFSETEPENVVVISENQGSIKVKNMSANIYNTLPSLEKLYQPEYFK